MSVVMNVGDIAMVRMEYVNALNTRAFNILHYQLTNVAVPGGGLFPGENAINVLPLLNQVVGVNVGGAWAGAACEEVLCTGISSQSIYPAPRSVLVNNTFAVPIAGSEPGPALPLQDAPTLVKRTNVGARWGIGRLFFVGLGEEQQTDGLVDVALVDDLTNFGNELALPRSVAFAGNTFTFTPVLWTPPSAALPTGRATPITSVTFNDRAIKTQRRRRPGKGI